MEPAEIPVEAYFRRAMAAIGVSAMEQISLMHVLLIGLRGCGMEIAKCLALSGVQRLTLMDDELVRDDDLTVGFLLRDGDQGKPKAKLIASRLNELVPFADVRTLNGTLSLDLLLNFHVVVFASTSLSQEEVVAYDEFCRAQDPPIGVVVAESHGLFGSVFTDFSARHHSVNTTSGIADVGFSVVNKRTLVHNDDYEDTVTVAVKEPLVRVMIEPGDHMALHEADARDSDPLILIVEEIISDRSVRLRPIDTGCTRHEVQMRLGRPFTMLRRVGSRVFTATHRSLRECLLFPGLPVSPTTLLPVEATARRNRSLHMASIAVHEFRREFGAFPCNNNAGHIKHMLARIEESFDKNAACQRPEGSNLLAIQRHDVDPSAMASALRCGSCEYLPLSALIAGHAALQVLKFSGALGPLLYPSSQFLYFDIIDLTGDVTYGKLVSASRRQSSLTAIFGSDVFVHLRDAKVTVIGASSINMEVVKNLKCGGIGSQCIRFVLDPDENPTIQAHDLHDCVLFSPANIGQSKASVLQNLEQAIVIQTPASGALTTLPWETWLDSSVIIADVSSLRGRLATDEMSRVYEKPMLVTYEDAYGLVRMDAAVPHSTASFSERLIAPAYKTNSAVFQFDHIPTSQSPGLKDGIRELLPSERVVQNARHCFDTMFQTAIQVATKYTAGRLSSKVSSTDELVDDDETLWMTWSVAQRGHGVDDFKACLRVAWQLLELLPLWMKSDRPASRQATTEEIDSQPDPDENRQNPDCSYAVFELDLDDPDHIQLLVATACSVAASVRVVIPPVESRRSVLTEVALESADFSLHHKPRTASSIRASFQAIEPSHLHKIVGRVQETSADLEDVAKGHLHFVQALSNLQLSWSEHGALSRVTTLPQLRRLCRDKCGFLPLTTILAALKTLQLVHVLTRSSESPIDVHEYGISTTPTASRSVLTVAPTPAPLIAKCMTHEITRGVPLRVVPQECTRWTKIMVPTSAALQTAKAIVQYVETRFQVTVHVIRHQARCIAIVNAQAMAAADGPLTQSVFDLCGSTAPFVLLDIVAVDTQGDVALAPLRVNRKE